MLMQGLKMCSLLRRNGALHAFAQLLWTRLELAILEQLGKYAFHDLQALFNVGHLSPAENDRDLNLVFMLEKTNSLFELELKIMVPGLGTQADLFQFGLVTGSAAILLLALLIFVFAVIHDTANRWFLAGSYLNQIQSDFSGSIESRIHIKDSQLLPVFTDYANLSFTNLIINSCRISTPLLFVLSVSLLWHSLKSTPSLGSGM
jgi:hypothetical protein